TRLTHAEPRDVRRHNPEVIAGTSRWFDGENGMSTSAKQPTRLASEDVILSAPMSYTGSAQRIVRLRRRAESGGSLVALTTAALILIVFAWVMITVWYLTWGLLLVPYRLVRRS